MPLPSDLLLLGEDALDPLRDPGFDPVLEPALALLESLLLFNFFPDPILFFFDDSGALTEDDLEFCRFNFPGTDWECFGDIFFLVCLDKGLT